MKCDKAVFKSIFDGHLENVTYSNDNKCIVGSQAREFEGNCRLV